MRAARNLSTDDFARMMEAHRPRRNELISIEDLAAEWDVSVRTLRRWNNLPDAPRRFRIGRRLMYRRAEVQHWFERRAQRRGDTQAKRKSD